MLAKLQFTGDFALFTIRFSPKLDEIYARWQHGPQIFFSTFIF
jgi:hypothetical protein